MNNVTSAKAGVVEAASSMATSTDLMSRMSNDTISSIVMDCQLTDEQELLRRSVREFAESELRPHVREWDEAQAFPRSLLPKLAELGLMGIQFPEQFGGAAMSPVDYCICIEELARVDPSVCLSVAAHNGLGSAHIFMFGSDEQKEKLSLIHISEP